MSMNLQKIVKATEECNRFMRTVAKMRTRMVKDKVFADEVEREAAISKETAAIRRSSLDLTRALAEMRK